MPNGRPGNGSGEKVSPWPTGCEWRSAAGWTLTYGRPAKPGELAMGGYGRSADPCETFSVISIPRRLPASPPRVPGPADRTSAGLTRPCGYVARGGFGRDSARRRASLTTCFIDVLPRWTASSSRSDRYPREAARQQVRAIARSTDVSVGRAYQHKNSDALIEGNPLQVRPVRPGRGR